METARSLHWEVDPRLSQLGQAFLDPSVRSILGERLTGALLDMKAFILWREHYYSLHEPPKPTPAESTYYHLLRWRSQYLALDIPFQAQDQSSQTDGQDAKREPHCLGEPCRIALLIFWHASTQLHSPGSILYRTLASQLKSALERCLSHSSTWKHFPGLMFWDLLLGAFITEGEPENQWFVANVARGVKCTFGGKFLAWEQMATVLERFLYLERLFKPGFNRTWDKAVEISCG